MLGRRPRSRLDLLKPNTAVRVEAQMAKHKKHHDQHAKHRPLIVGNSVYVRNYHGGCLELLRRRQRYQCHFFG